MYEHGIADAKKIEDRSFKDGDYGRIEFAATLLERLRGMLFRKPDGTTRLLIPCNDIHTFGMKYPLDIAFISKQGTVLEVHRNVPPGHRIKRRDASMVAERFAKDGEWFYAGEVIGFANNAEGGLSSIEEGINVNLQFDGEVIKG